MNFVMNHAPGAGSMARHVDQQSSALPLYHVMVIVIITVIVIVIIIIVIVIIIVMVIIIVITIIIINTRGLQVNN